MTEKDPLQVLWKSQTETPPTPSLPDVKQRALKFQSVIRRRNFFEYVVSLYVLYFFGKTALNTNNTLLAAASILCVLAIVFVCYKLFSNARSASRSELDMTLDFIDFHRSMLRRQHKALASVWKWYLAPFIPGLLLFVFASHFYNGASEPLLMSALYVLLKFLALGAVFFGIHWLNKREAKRIDIEIAKLDELDESRALE